MEYVKPMVWFCVGELICVVFLVIEHYERGVLAPSGTCYLSGNVGDILAYC